MGARAVAIVSPIYYRLSPESVYAYFAEIARLHAHRYHALQHSDVRQPHRRADHSPPGRRFPARRRHQGFLRRPRLHDAHDRRHPPHPSRFHLPHRLGGRARAHADGRLRRRHQRQQQRRPRSHPPHLRTLPRRQIRRGHAVELPHHRPLRHHALPLRVSRRVPRRRQPARLRFRQRPPAADRRRRRPTAPRWRRCCNASWPISNWWTVRAEGCAPRTGQPATDKLEQVVFEVMHELEKRGIF